MKCLPLPPHMRPFAEHKTNEPLHRHLQNVVSPAEIGAELRRLYGNDVRDLFTDAELATAYRKLHGGNLVGLEVEIADQKYCEIKGLPVENRFPDGSFKAYRKRRST